MCRCPAALTRSLSAKKTAEELDALAKAGPLHLYLGTENGNDSILELMDKGHTAEEAVKQLHRLDKAGIPYTVFYILGLGGEGMGQSAGRDTARLFNKVHPERIVTTGMTVTDGTGAREMEDAGQYVQASEREKIKELSTFLENLEVGSFYDGAHALNPVHARFDTSDAAMKKHVISELDRILTSYTDAQLEDAIDRPAMERQSAPPKPRT